MFGHAALIPIALLTLKLCIAAQTHPAQTPGTPAANDRSGIKEFVPGVKIDWTNRCVELDSRVVFRKGPLELLACSPQTREHESILVVAARPLHIYQALGLIGLTPGSPVGYDEANDRWLPPSGEQVRITLRYKDDKDAKREVPAAEWLKTTKEKKIPPDMTWVFAGSRKLPDGRFVADLDGTVICLVDFDSALIAVGQLHSADNELLWLEANTQAIPPIDTPVTIIIGPAKAEPQPADSAPKREPVEKKPPPGDNSAPNGSHPNQESRTGTRPARSPL